MTILCRCRVFHNSKCSKVPSEIIFFLNNSVLCSSKGNSKISTKRRKLSKSIISKGVQHSRLFSWLQLQMHSFLRIQAEWCAFKFDRNLSLFISFKAEVDQQIVKNRLQFHQCKSRTCNKLENSTI